MDRIRKGPGGLSPPGDCVSSNVQLFAPQGESPHAEPGGLYRCAPSRSTAQPGGARGGTAPPGCASHRQWDSAITEMGTIMFNGNRNREERTAPGTAQTNARRGQFSVLGADILVTGDITATADLHIDGRVEGDVRCGSLVQGAESQIFGRVEAEDARLAGLVEGAVHVRRLIIERTARITGDVEYETLTVEQGGHIDGRLKHREDTIAAAAAAAPPPLLQAVGGETA